ncbi:MAG: transcriptional repressor [Opitutae bacterium]|nr:transcriptional repressor [Opitutae bacterium]
MIAATQSNHPLGATTEPGETQKPLEQACACLRTARMRITKPRVALLAALIRRAGPTSIEQLHQDLPKNACDLVTVYRCLAAFERIGLVRRSFLHSGTSLYEITFGHAHHYHVVCKSCGTAERVEYFSVAGMERLLKDRGYAQLSHVVEFFGVCPSCQAAAGTRNPAVKTPAASRLRA